MTSFFFYRAPTELMHFNDGWAETSAPNAEQALEVLCKKTTVTPEQLQVRVGALGRWHFADRVERAHGGLA